jgi:hypothetical protein
MSYATKSWSKDGGGQYPNTNPTSRRAWLNDLSALVDTVDPTSHQITSTLSLLSASVKQGSALPPYIQRKYPEAPHFLIESFREVTNIFSSSASTL